MAAGYAAARTLDAGCDYLGMDDQQRAWTHAATQFLMVLVTRHRSKLKSGQGEASQAPKSVVDDVLPTRPPKRVYHQGDLADGVSPRRPLSTSPDPDLRHYHPDGDLNQFDIPADVYDEWMFDGTIQTFNDLHLPSGNIRPEIRIMPPNSGQMNDFLVPRGGGG